MVAIIAGVVAGFITLSVLKFLVSRQRWKLKDSGSGSRQTMTKPTMNPEQFMPTNLCRHFPLEEITTATKNINDTFIIGAGGFGNVSKDALMVEPPQLPSND
ncbi:putative non-specific serine/threonine protein kinase [Rosa chinensis]|uniref:Putative non-specific serine/threonine protein kinase n=1 Tax=Rosa chinensis TaxID=74649 RepID=A0A2P6QST4_ROSCH|nr:putative non-specific serine/threonine protein kinase [Rosa chinensis]